MVERKYMYTYIYKYIKTGIQSQNINERTSEFRHKND